MKSMNQTIESILYLYNSNHTEIDSSFYDIAVEETTTVANTTTDVVEKSNDNQLMKKMGNQIQKMFLTLNGIIQRAFMKFTNFINRVAQTDLGFKQKCRTAIKDKKPLEGIRLITYEYDEAALEQELNKLNMIITKCFNSMKGKTSYTALHNTSEKSILDQNGNEIEKMVLQEMHLPGNISNINEYFLYVKKLYRKDKKEILFVSSRTRDYYNITEGHKDITAKIKKSQNVILNQVATAKSNLHNTIQNKDIDKDIKRRAINQCRNLSHLYNIYTSFLDIYFQLKIERIMTYRTVLKKLYDF